MSDKICVYFNNDYRAVFTLNKVSFIKDDTGQKYLLRPCVEHGDTVINWSNVCFIRPYEEKDQEDGD